MQFYVGRIVPGKDFYVDGISYIGAPRSNTAMYITKKVERLLSALEPVEHCLIFAESGIQLLDGVESKHAFSFSSNPQLAYAKFANQYAEERFENEKAIQYRCINGSYISEDSQVGENAYIEPGCVIGPDVSIGNNARVLAGSIIRRTTIGDFVLINEHAVIGAAGFTMAEDENGDKLRIPTLGRIIVGNHVEIGAHDNISCGSGGNTIIEDNVKIDALVHIGHDVHLHKNVELTAGCIIGGYGDIGDHAYMGVNSASRNRISIGSNTIIGMGSTVIKSVGADEVYAGNPAREIRKNI